MHITLIAVLCLAIGSVNCTPPQDGTTATAEKATERSGTVEESTQPKSEQDVAKDNENGPSKESKVNSEQPETELGKKFKGHGIEAKKHNLSFIEKFLIFLRVKLPVWALKPFLMHRPAQLRSEMGDQIFFGRTALYYGTIAERLQEEAAKEKKEHRKKELLEMSDKFATGAIEKEEIASGKGDKKGKRGNKEPSKPLGSVDDAKKPVSGSANQEAKESSA